MAQTKHMTDMTVGSPLRHIVLFTLPLLIGNLFQQFYNVVDSLVVGNYVGADALAAVGTCGSLGFLFFSLSSGLAVGIGILASQYFGARDEGQIRATIANAAYILTLACFCGFCRCRRKSSPCRCAICRSPAWAWRLWRFTTAWPRCFVLLEIPNRRCIS